jgi:hypothetical protein
MVQSGFLLEFFLSSLFSLAHVFLGSGGHNDVVPAFVEVQYSAIVLHYLNFFKDIVSRDECCFSATNEDISLISVL